MKWINLPNWLRKSIIAGLFGVGFCLILIIPLLITKYPNPFISILLLAHSIIPLILRIFTGIKIPLFGNEFFRNPGSVIITTLTSAFLMYALIAGIYTAIIDKIKNKPHKKIARIILKILIVILILLLLIFTFVISRI